MAAAALLSASVAGASLGPVHGFGHGGVATTGGTRIIGVAAERTGTVIAVGASGSSMLVERLRANGSVQRTFHAGRGTADAVAVQPDGKIVVAGVSASSKKLPLGQMVIERFTPGGSPDRRFGHGGVVTIGNGTVANAVALGPRGTIVAGGSMRGPDATPRVALVELSASGSPVGSFGSGGLAEIDLGPYSTALGVAVQRDGKVVFAGQQSPNTQTTNGLVARATAHGALDGSFGHRGVTTYLHPHGGGASSLNAVALAPGNRIVAGGADLQNAGQHALFVRLTGRGAYDHGFGGGAVTTPSAPRLVLNGANIGVRGVAVTRGGAVLGAGSYTTGATTLGAVWAVSSHGRIGSPVRVALSGASGTEFSSVALGAGRLFAGGDRLGGLGGTAAGGIVAGLSLSGIR